MIYVCPADGHLFQEPRGRYCPHHGAPLFTDCDRCGARWERVEHTYGGSMAASFCVGCGSPASWVGRTDRIRWIKSRLGGETDLDAATRLELAELLDRLVVMSPDDPNVVTAWHKIKTAAPKLWEFARPVLQTLISEGAKKHLGLEGQ